MNFRYHWAMDSENFFSNMAVIMFGSNSFFREYFWWNINWFASYLILKFNIRCVAQTGDAFFPRVFRKNLPSDSLVIRVEGMQCRTWARSFCLQTQSFWPAISGTIFTTKKKNRPPVTVSHSTCYPLQQCHGPSPLMLLDKCQPSITQRLASEWKGHQQ